MMLGPRASHQQSYQPHWWLDPPAVSSPAIMGHCETAQELPTSQDQ